MADSNDDCDRNRQADDEQNPFILFRRYADEQMSSLLQGLIGLPSAFTPHSSNERFLQSEEHQTQRQENEMTAGAPSSSVNASDQRRTRDAGLETEAKGISVNKYAYVNPPSGSHQREARHPAGLSDDAHRHHHDYTFSPPLLIGDDFPFWRGIPRGLSGDAFHTAWPLGYIIFSPYSPLRLEQHERLREHGSKWRDAFEDLLAVHAGQGLLETPRERTRVRDEGASDWVAALLAHGLADGWKRIDVEGRSQERGDQTMMGSDTRHPGSDADEDAATELDLYERFFASAMTPLAGSAATKSSASVHSSSGSNHETPGVSDRAESSSVISALTTTERKVMPDGTVHTKVVLKKKFADGREEGSETVHITQSTSQHIDRATPSPKGRATDPNPAGGDDDGSKRKGWFWSG